MVKVFILIFITLYVSSFCFAISDKNAVFLELDNDNIQAEDNIKKGSVNMNSIDVEKTKNKKENEHSTLIYQDVNRMKEGKKSYSKNIERKILKDTSVGASYSASGLGGKINDTVSVYSKYQKKSFGLTTAYSQDRETAKEKGISSGSISVSPELSLNKHIKLKNVYTDNMSTNQQKNEIVLSVRPFQDDRLDLDLGAGQTFSNSNQPSQSQINFGTKFRF